MGGFKELTILIRLILRERERNREICIHVVVCIHVVYCVG